MIPLKIKDRLIIYGSGKSIVNLYEINLPDYELWGLNNLYSIYSSADRWFELHQFKKMGIRWMRRGQNQWGGHSIKYHLKKLDELNIPIFMHKRNEIVKKSVEFPFIEILNNFQFHYFTCTVCWQLALAIMMRYKEIYMIGVDLEDYWERIYQKGAVEYFLGLAQGMGIKIRIPLDSPILKAPFLYSFEKENLYQ